MRDLALVLFAVGALVLITGLMSERIRQSLFSQPIIALLLGIALGPAVLNLLDPAEWGDPLLTFSGVARLTLAISLMGIALRLPPRFVVRQWRSSAVLIGAAMPLMAISAGIWCWLVLDWPFWLAMLLGAVLSPTDPILATSIVTGKFAEDHLPEDLRHVISAESGVNDGMAHPLVFLALFLMIGQSFGEVLVQWAGVVLAYEAGFGAGFGLVTGYAAGRIMEWMERKRWIEEISLLAVSLSLTLFVLGATELLGANGLLAVFASGLGFDAAVSAKERLEEEKVQEAVNQFFTFPIFSLLGLLIPWNDWFDLGWRGVAMVIGVLFLRRLPWIALLHPWIPLLRRRQEAAFAGWFGPIGVAALLYAAEAMQHAGHKEIWTATSLVVGLSVVVHGMTAAPFSRLYSRRSSRRS